jgi:hypothetical protein
MSIYTNREDVSAPVNEKIVADTAAVLARALGKL